MMTSNDLTEEQAKKLHEEVFAMWKRLNQFYETMQKRGFDTKDDFRIKLESARNQVWDLRVFLMYLEMSKGSKPDLEQMRRKAEEARLSQQNSGPE